MIVATPIDFLVITALPEERDAVLQRLPGHTLLPPTAGDASVYYQATLPVTYSDGTTTSYALIVTFPPEMSRAPAAALAATAIPRWQPSHVLLVGIAGGIGANGVALGDLLIANQIVDYEVAKAGSDNLARRWHAYDVQAGLLQRARAFPGQRWHAPLARLRPERGQPRMHVGPIATGDKIIEDPALLAELLGTWLKLIGVEMEAGGVAPAARQTNPPPGFFMIRAASDLADPDKETTGVKAWRPYACAVAAAFAVAFLRSGPVVSRTASTKAEQRTRPERGARRSSVASLSTSPRPARAPRTPEATAAQASAPALAALMRAIEMNSPAVEVRAEEFMRAIAADILQCPTADAAGGFNETLSAAIAASAVLAAMFGKASRSVADHDVRSAAERLFGGFANLIALFPRDAILTLRTPEVREEVARFLAHELFLTLFAQLLRAGRWETIHYLLSQHIIVVDHPLGFGSGPIPYPYLARLGGALDARATRHGHPDTPFRVAQLYALHEDHGSLAGDAPLAALLDADLLIWLRKAADRLRDPADQAWTAHLLTYWSASPPLFRRVAHKADAEGLARALGLLAPRTTQDPAMLRQFLHNQLELPEAGFPWRPTALAELHRVGTF